MQIRTLVFVAALAAGSAAEANVVTFSGDTTGGPTFNRPVLNLSALSFEGANVRYNAYQLTVNTTGAYSFETVARFDSFAFLYSPSFSPVTPLTNASLASDDLLPGVVNASGFSAMLTAGQTYTFVNTGFGTVDFGAFVNTIGGPGTVSVGATLSALPDGLFVHSGTTTGGPTFNRPLENLSGLSLAGSNVAYDRFDFTVGTSGDYSFLTTGGFDTFSLLYGTAFNPVTPLVNARAANDDLFDTPPVLGSSGFASTLVAGVHYSLITTGFDATQSGAFTVMLAGPGAIRTGVITAVPEPDSTLLLLAGLGALGWRVRRRA